MAHADGRVPVRASVSMHFCSGALALVAHTAVSAQVAGRGVRGSFQRAHSKACFHGVGISATCSTLGDCDSSALEVILIKAALMKHHLDRL